MFKKETENPLFFGANWFKIVHNKDNINERGESSDPSFDNRR